MEKHLHIICLNVPYPVDYGGVFDLFYKLPALKARGIKIHLHCFEYGRGQQPELNKYCETVEYYKRIEGWKGFSFSLPYIVATRRNSSMFDRLLQDDHPILMEGVHCTYLLNDSRFASRKCFVRLHNVEHVYYKNLYYNSSSITKKLYYLWESKALLKYEKKIAKLCSFLTVIPKDTETYKLLGATHISYLPLFLPGWEISSKTGVGTYCLYHGDLSVSENEKAALWLAKKVFNNIDIKLIIAGKNPSRRVKDGMANRKNISLVANPDEKEMQYLIAGAQMNILPSFNATGIKLKLLNALYNGRHCVVNEATVQGTGVEVACHVGNNATAIKSIIFQLNRHPFEEEELKLRHLLLDEMFDNDKNALELMREIWG
ncbi:MAG: putative mannosyltransferase [Segetibacter sp.]|nr:putative mannosyltransferase [Segetibacter sp.]